MDRFSPEPNALRVLVYQLGSIGDTVVTIPALKAIRRHYGPHARISLLHETRPDVDVTPADLLSGSAVVDDFISYPYEAGRLGGLRSAVELWWWLRRRHFQAVVYLAPSERPAISVQRDAQFFRLCGIPERVGFHAFPPDFLYPVDEQGQPARVQHEALCRLERLHLDGVDVSVESDLSKPFLEPSASAVEAARRWLAARQRYPERPLVALCPGAKQPANFWPVERFIEIGRRLIDQNRFELLVVGGPAERRTGERMIAAWGEGLNAAGHLSVLGSAALLSQCVFIVGLDTGTTHLAAAMGIPCVALYGERDNPGRWEPLGQGHVLLRQTVPCAGCRLIMKPCVAAGHPCMTGISVDAVWQAIQQIERRRGGPSDVVVA